MLNFSELFVSFTAPVSDQYSSLAPLPNEITPETYGNQQKDAQELDIGTSSCTSGVVDILVNLTLGACHTPTESCVVSQHHQSNLTSSRLNDPNLSARM